LERLGGSGAVERAKAWGEVKALSTEEQAAAGKAYADALKEEEEISVLKVAVETWTGLPDNTVRGYYAEQVLRRQLWALTAHNTKVISDWATRRDAMKTVQQVEPPAVRASLCEVLVLLHADGVNDVRTALSNVLTTSAMPAFTQMAEAEQRASAAALRRALESDNSAVRTAAELALTLVPVKLIAADIAQRVGQQDATAATRSYQLELFKKIDAATLAQAGVAPELTKLLGDGLDAEEILRS